MTGISFNSAKSFVGKRANIRLKDSSVIVNVLISRIIPSEKPRSTVLQFKHGRDTGEVSLHKVTEIKVLDSTIINLAGK